MTDSPTSLLPRSHDAPALLAAATTGRRRVVHVVVDPSTPVELIRRLHGAGCDLVTVRLGGLGSAAAPELLASLTAEVPALSTGVRVESMVDAALVADCVRAGATYLAGSPLALDSGQSIEAALELFAAVDSAAAPHRVAREIAAPHMVAPPAVLVSHLLVDLAGAVAQGARHVVLGYPALGNLVQDVAALQVLQRLAPKVVPAIVDDGAIELSVTQWVGAPAPVLTNGWAAAAAATMAAGLADATQVVVVPLAADDPESADSGLVPGVEFTRQLLDLLIDQQLEDSPQLVHERDRLEAEVTEVLAAIGPIDPAAVARAVADGRLLGAARAGRDARGAVRAQSGSAGSWSVWTDHPTLP